MEYFDLIEKRHSLRNYTGESVPDEIIRKIIDAAIISPSGGNMQGYRILLIKNREVIERLAGACFGQNCVKTAAAVIAFVCEPEVSAAKYGERGSTLYSLQDATIATAFAHLAATDIGLGSVWVGAFDDDRVHETLNISAPARVVSLLPFGYPDDTPRERTRKSYKEMVTVIE